MFFFAELPVLVKANLPKPTQNITKSITLNILYVEYTGDLHQDITDMDFIDDPPEISEQERFQRHNRFCVP